MQSYAEVYQRYFDPDRFSPGTPKSMERELPRASAYQALISLKHKYHCDSKPPLDVNDLPTSAPLFDNNELLDRAEQVTMDWTRQHPGRTSSPLKVQDETRRQAQNLWKIWTESNRTTNRLDEPRPVPRRASGSETSPSHSGSFNDRRGSMPLQQQRNLNGSVPLYDKNVEPVACNTVPSNRNVPAPAPIDEDARPAPTTFPVASDHPVTESNQPVNAGGDENVLVPADSKTANEPSGSNHVAPVAVATGAGAAATGAAVAANAGPSDAAPPSEASSAKAPWESPEKKINFANQTKDDQIRKKEEPQMQNTGGSKDRIAEQPELFDNGGLTGTQHVGKIDLKNL